jgi:tetratricopeptide (TPR) repeat protein
MNRACFAAFALLLLLLPARAAQSAGGGPHEVEGRVWFRGGGGVGQVRVRLLRLPESRPVAETYTQREGQFRFTHVREGEYAVETIENERFEAALQNVSVNPVIRNQPTTFRVSIELSEKAAGGGGERPPPGVASADVDAGVPRKAVERYLAAMRALREDDFERAASEFRKAIAAHPPYYAARLEYGRELRRRGDAEQAEEVLRPLLNTAPRKVSARVEYGRVLLALKRHGEAVAQLEEAAGLQGAGWEPHYYLGWALLETRADKAETHLRKAIALDEMSAARAHLALARLAHERGQRAAAVAHLEAFLTLSPDSQEAASARALAEKLRAEGRP